VFGNKSKFCSDMRRRKYIKKIDDFIFYVCKTNKNLKDLIIKKGIIKMERNKENSICQSFGDRFIPTQVRSCAFQV
jgi:hypothetical protein